ncbi:TniQ family protein [Brucella intermedia]|uniref:TniQ family protein n=1 Tax=Brucella intermedia TaxID=94625 RepID=UPI0021C667C8|nr:TniQ family protein [Brucella intermedia]UXO85528.1 TniQ family protein [Brucella intermedia]
MTLPVTLPFHEDESPISLVSRLARANSYDSLQSLLGFTHTSREAIVRGDHDALAEISELSGISTERLSNASIVHQHPGSNWKLGHAIFNKEMRPGKMLRYCPHCVLNDMETGIGRAISRPYARSWWSCRGIEGCPEHGRKLVEHLVTSFDQRDDFATFVEQNVQTIRNQACTDQQSSAPFMDRFLRDRIFKRAEADDLVDTLDAHIVAELSGYMGKFIAIHKLTHFQDEATDQREWGFRLICEGQAELERIIIETIEQKRPMVRFVEQFFGQLVNWLRRNKLKPEYQPLVSMFQNIAEKNMPFGPGMIFINPVEHRYVYCVNSAHTDFGIHKKRIKTLLASHGLTNRINLHDSAIYFDAERARPILEAASETLTSTAAAEILGVDEEQFRTLVKVGFVGQVEERENERGYLRIPQAELDSFQSALLANAESVEHDEDEWGSLMELAHAFTMAFENILQLIIEGSVDARVITGQGGLLTRLRVSKLEVQRIRLQSLSDMQENFVTFEQALDLLGTSDVTLSQLLRRGYIKEKDYKRSSKMARLINEDSLQEFKSKFISLVDFCQKVGVNRVGMKKRLADLGVSPLFDDNKFVASYYNLSDLEKRGAFALGR